MRSLPPLPEGARTLRDPESERLDATHDLVPRRRFPHRRHLVVSPARRPTAIYNEIITVKDPEKLATIAAERKPTMMLLPYGIPICVGSIAYFFYAGMV